MSMFFRYKGSLEFETEAEARKHYDILVNDHDSWFSAVAEELELTGKKIKFKANGNFNSYSSCETTKDLLYKAARNAIKGKIDVDEGDGEDNLWNLEVIPASLKK